MKNNTIRHIAGFLTTSLLLSVAPQRLEALPVPHDESTFLNSPVKDMRDSANLLLAAANTNKQLDESRTVHGEIEQSDNDGKMSLTINGLTETDELRRDSDRLVLVIDDPSSISALRSLHGEKGTFQINNVNFEYTFLQGSTLAAVLTHYASLYGGYSANISLETLSASSGDVSKEHLFLVIKWTNQHGKTVLPVDKATNSTESIFEFQVADSNYISGANTLQSPYLRENQQLTSYEILLKDLPLETLVDEIELTTATNGRYFVCQNTQYNGGSTIQTPLGNLQVVIFTPSNTDQNSPTLQALLTSAVSKIETGSTTSAITTNLTQLILKDAKTGLPIAIFIFAPDSSSQKAQITFLKGSLTDNEIQGTTTDGHQKAFTSPGTARFLITATNDTPPIAAPMSEAPIFNNIIRDVTVGPNNTTISFQMALPLNGQQITFQQINFADRAALLSRIAKADSTLLLSIGYILNGPAQTEIIIPGRVWTPIATNQHDDAEQRKPSITVNDTIPTDSINLTARQGTLLTSGTDGVTGYTTITITAHNARFTFGGDGIREGHPYDASLSQQLSDPVTNASTSRAYIDLTITIQLQESADRRVYINDDDVVPSPPIFQRIAGRARDGRRKSNPTASAEISLGTLSITPQLAETNRTIALIGRDPYEGQYFRPVEGSFGGFSFQYQPANSRFFVGFEHLQFETPEDSLDKYLARLYTSSDLIIGYALPGATKNFTPQEAITTELFFHHQVSLGLGLQDLSLGYEAVETGFQPIPSVAYSLGACVSPHAISTFQRASLCVDGQLAINPFSHDDGQTSALIQAGANFSLIINP